MTDDFYTHMQMSSMREIMVGSGGCGESYTRPEPLRETYKGFPTSCTVSAHDEKCKIAHMSESDQRSFTKAQELARTTLKVDHECWFGCKFGKLHKFMGGN